MSRALRFAFCLVIGLASACSGDEDSSDGGALAEAGVAADTGVSPDATVTDSGPPDSSGELDAGAAMDASTDAGTTDAAAPDASPPDAGFADAAAPDASPQDAGQIDSGAADAAAPDAAAADATASDAAPADASAPDAAPADASAADAAPADASAADASAPDAGPADAGGSGPCDVVVDLPEAIGGQVGSSGGSPGPSLTCPAGQEIIGIAVRESNQNTANGGPSAVGLTIVCAAVSFTAAGPQVGAETQQEVAGNGQFGWTPATQSTITRCPAGWLMSGLEASRGTSGNRFLELTLTCSELAATGATTGNAMTIYVMGSLTEAGTYDSVACPSGQVVRRIGTRIGAGFDAAILFCAAPACAP